MQTHIHVVQHCVPAASLESSTLDYYSIPKSEWYSLVCIPVTTLIHGSGKLCAKKMARCVTCHASYDN